MSFEDKLEKWQQGIEQQRANAETARLEKEEKIRLAVEAEENRIKVAREIVIAYLDNTLKVKELFTKLQVTAVRIYGPPGWSWRSPLRSEPDYQPEYADSLEPSWETRDRIKYLNLRFGLQIPPDPLRYSPLHREYAARKLSISAYAGTSSRNIHDSEVEPRFHVYAKINYALNPGPNNPHFLSLPTSAVFNLIPLNEWTPESFEEALLRRAGFEG
ncbi:MAG: hypothetical protein Q7R43_05660 [Candidatus Daviesbacteria bacterium]|nr:hypothetical protein [Candidatus Daviesbacteria bacterium]